MQAGCKDHTTQILPLSAASPFSAADVAVRDTGQGDPKTEDGWDNTILNPFKRPGAIKQMSKYRFYLHFLGRELVGPEWVLSMGSQFRSSWLLRTASYISSILGALVPCVYLMNYYYVYLLGASFLSTCFYHSYALFTLPTSSISYRLLTCLHLNASYEFCPSHLNFFCSLQQKWMFSNNTKTHSISWGWKDISCRSRAFTTKFMTWPRTIGRLTAKCKKRWRHAQFLFPKLPIIYIASLLQTGSEGDTERPRMSYKCRLFHTKGNIRSVEYFSSKITLELAVEEPKCHHYNIWSLYLQRSGFQSQN